MKRGRLHGEQNKHTLVSLVATLRAATRIWNTTVATSMDHVGSGAGRGTTWNSTVEILGGRWPYRLPLDGLPMVLDLSPILNAKRININR